jgi:hypothetical protein
MPPRNVSGVRNVGRKDAFPSREEEQRKRKRNSLFALHICSCFLSKATLFQAKKDPVLSREEGSPLSSFRQPGKGQLCRFV